MTPLLWRSRIRWWHQISQLRILTFVHHVLKLDVLGIYLLIDKFVELICGDMLEFPVLALGHEPNIHLFKRILFSLLVCQLE